MTSASTVLAILYLLPCTITQQYGLISQRQRVTLRYLKMGASSKQPAACRWSDILWESTDDYDFFETSGRTTVSDLMDKRLILLIQLKLVANWEYELSVETVITVTAWWLINSVTVWAPSSEPSSHSAEAAKCSRWAPERNQNKSPQL